MDHVLATPGTDRGPVHGHPRGDGQLPQKLHFEGVTVASGAAIFRIPSTANCADRGALTPRGRVNKAHFVFLAVVEGKARKEKTTVQPTPVPCHTTGCIALHRTACGPSPVSHHFNASHYQLSTSPITGIPSKRTQVTG